MQNKTPFILMSLLLALFAANSFAADKDTPQKDKSHFYCPAPSALEKDPIKQTWSADRRTFRSYDVSFAEHIGAFTGAQWVGTKVGQITCVYQTLPKPSFPVLLVFHTLTLEPSGHAWTKDLGGYKDCHALDREQCPFKMRVKSITKDIYKEAGSLKSEAE